MTDNQQFASLMAMGLLVIFMMQDYRERYWDFITFEWRQKILGMMMFIATFFTIVCLMLGKAISGR